MPTSSSRLGYVYSPDEVHIPRNDLHIWKSILQSLHARWLVLHASPERAIPESLITELQDIQVEPIVFIPAPVGSLRAADLGPLFRSYARWGLRYVVTYDRPNVRAQWPPLEWARHGLVERFLDVTIPILEEQAEAGLYPIFPALEPGGDYWDTAFLQSALQSLVRRGKQDLLNRLVLGIYSWTNGKPLNWGAGGPERWPEARPYRTPPDCEDQQGFRIFEWYAQISRQVLKRELPLLVVAGGARHQAADAETKFDVHTEQNLAIARAFLQGQIPDYVLNYSFHFLHRPDTAAGEHAAWYPDIDQPLPIVTALQNILKHPPVDQKAAIRKPLNHYILLPAEWKASGALQEALPYAQTSKAVVGFSAKEARMAHRVTLFGGEAFFDPRVEQELRFAGCNVEHRVADRMENQVPDSNGMVVPAHKDISTAGGPHV